MARRVIIYDPNYLNPYGLELAAVLRDGGRVPELVHPRGLIRSAPGVRSRGWAQPERGGFVKRAMDRLIAPIRVVISARRSPLVVVWTRGVWDAFVFAARSLMIAPCTVVHHNPRQVRPRSGIAGNAERALLRNSKVVVHNRWLAGLVAEDFRSVYVAPHPPYRITVQAIGDVGVREPRGRVVAFIGGLRADKGSHELPTIAQSSGGDWELLIAGPDRLSPSDTSLLKSFGVNVSYAAEGPPNDLQLIEAIRSARVVIAPYRAVTESGSIHLALAAGASVVAFDSPGVRHLATRIGLVKDAEELGSELRQILVSDDGDSSADYEGAYEQTVADWIRVLNE